MPRPTFARVDLDAVMHNVKEVKRFIGGRKICAAVKADAYGHGAPAVAQAMCAAGVDMFAVAMTEEAVELREAGISRPVILLTAVPEDDIEDILDHGITACLVEESFAHELSEHAVRRGKLAEAHVKIDTGMRRVGIDHAAAADAVLRISRLPGIRLTGLFTHFSCADAKDLAFSREQLARFLQVVGDLKKAGMRVPMLHIANSAGTLRMPEAHLECVRPGLILYGLRPRGVEDPPVKLRPAMSLHTRISFCKKTPAGEKLGYGQTFTTWRESVIATLPIGYHDGYVRQYSNAGQVLVRGRRAPVVGRVCMDQTLIDVTDVPGAQRGDEVVIYGEQEGRSIGVEEMAARLDRIPYELTCAVAGRVRRQFVLGGEIVAETPMRPLVPSSLVRDIFPAAQAVADEGTLRKARRRGAA